MSATLHRIGFLLIALAYFISVGGHFAVTQGVAWGGMMVSAIKRGTEFRQAVSETLDGAHPCAMCLSVAKARAAEKSDAKPDADGKEKLKSPVLTAVRVVLPAPAPVRRMAAGSESGSGQLRERPPTPPPRAA